MASTALHVAWCYLLIVKWGMGITGASIAICITYSTNFLALACYTGFIDVSERAIWTIDSQAFKDWYGYLKIGIPGALMIILDMWCYEIITLLSGYLSIEATAAQIILNNIQIFFLQLALGISIAASTMIGSSVGENDLAKARSYLKMTLAFGLSLFLILQILV